MIADLVLFIDVAVTARRNLAIADSACIVVAIAVFGVDALVADLKLASAIAGLVLGVEVSVAASGGLADA